MENSKEKNIQSFSSPEAVKAYSSGYLRSGENYVIQTYMLPGYRVLDVGCGAGRTTNYIWRNGCQVIGIDLAAPLIARAKALYPEIDFRTMDASKLDFPTGAFDVVFFSFNGLDNFCSMPDRHEALRELLRVLKPGGFLIYSSHNGLAIPRTRSGWKSLAKNFWRYRIGPHWRVEEHGFGKLFQYYNNVWNEKSQLKKLGLSLEKVVANGKVARLPAWLLPFFEKFPLFIIKK